MGAGWRRRGSLEHKLAGWKAGGADMSTQLQCLEEVPVKAGNPETANETHRTPTRARRTAFPMG